MSSLGHSSLPPKPSMVHALPSRPSSAAASSSSSRTTVNHGESSVRAIEAANPLTASTYAKITPPNDQTMPDTSAAGIAPHISSQQSTNYEMESYSQTMAMRSPSSASHRTHSLPPKPDTTSKRKLASTDFPADEAVSKPRVDTSVQSDLMSTALPSGQTPKSETTNTKPKIIPILPVPLPSKRFKKGQTKSLLIPIEQIPVFALPPLPVITDPVLSRTVFQHQSMFPRTKGRFEDPPDAPATHYEKLEHVGDSILGMIVTTWLQETKPHLTPGTASRLKSHLVSNATLSHISGLYNLPAKLNGDPHQLAVLRNQTDVRAAIVEAYIAGVYFSFPAEKRLTEAMPMLDEWLREMYEPLYDFFYTYMKSEYDQHRTAIGQNADGTVQTISDEKMARIDKASQGMASVLKVYGDTKDRKIEYDEDKYDTTLGLLWHMKVSVNGVMLGEATRADRRIAKNVAAWEAAKALGLAVGPFSPFTRRGELAELMKSAE